MEAICCKQCHRCLQALPGWFQLMRTHITRTGREDTWHAPRPPIQHMHAQPAHADVTYSVPCSSDKTCFPQLRIKCGITKSCPGTHTALQVPINSVFHVHINMFHNADFLLATYNNVAMSLALYWLDSSVILHCLVLLVHVSENQDLWISIASSAHLGAVLDV